MLWYIILGCTVLFIVCVARSPPGRPRENARQVAQKSAGHHTIPYHTILLYHTILYYYNILYYITKYNIMKQGGSGTSECKACAHDCGADTLTSKSCAVRLWRRHVRLSVD